MWTKISRYLINIVCLALGIALSISFFYSLSEDPLFRAIVPIATITIESLAQYMLAIGRYSWRHGKKPYALLLFVIYAWYLIVFALLSGMSYFTAEIAAKEELAAKANYTVEVSRRKWEQNNTLIDTLNRQLEVEAETGFGSRSKAIMVEIGKLKAEQAELETSFQAAADASVEVQDTFGALAEALGAPPNTLKVFVFGTVIMFVYLGLILTNWDINPEGKAKKPADKPVPIKTAAEQPVAHRSAAKVDGLGSCPVCSGPLKPRQTYCSNACRQKAFRDRRKREYTGELA